MPTTGGPDNTLVSSADGTAVSSTTSAGHFTVYGLDGTRRLAAKFREPLNEDEGYQNLLALSADGTVLAVHGDSLNEPKIEVHDVAAKKVHKILLGGQTIHKLAVSPDGKRLAAGTSEGQILIWDLPNGAANPDRAPRCGRGPRLFAKGRPARERQPRRHRTDLETRRLIECDRWPAPVARRSSAFPLPADVAPQSLERDEDLSLSLLGGVCTAIEPAGARSRWSNCWS